MNTREEHKSIDLILDRYRVQLDIIPDDLFTVTPPNGGWSFAEAYSHILKATMLSSISLERCAVSNSNHTNEGTNFWGKYVMLTGSFPPIKIKVPESVAKKMPAEKISKEDAKNELIKCRERIDSMSMLIEKSSPKSKTKHPRLGMFNALEWFKFIRIHLNHHLKQLERIKKSFKIQ